MDFLLGLVGSLVLVGLPCAFLVGVFFGRAGTEQNPLPQYGGTSSYLPTRGSFVHERPPRIAKEG